MTAYLSNVPIRLALLPIARRLLPAPQTQTAGSGGANPAGRNLDPVGVGLLGTGVLLVLLPIIHERDWRGPAKWLLRSGGLHHAGRLRSAGSADTCAPAGSRWWT